VKAVLEQVLEQMEELKSGGSVTRGLDQVAWADVVHACGPAVDIPPLFEDLQSAGKIVRGKAWRELYGNLGHQGSIYQATSDAVPFLLEPLEDPDIPERCEVLIFVTCRLTKTAAAYGLGLIGNGDLETVEDVHRAAAG